MHEQLKTEWRVLLHLKEAISISSKVSKLLSKALHDPRRITNAPAVPDCQLKPQELPLQGLLPVALPGPSKNPTSTILQELQSPHARADSNLALTVSSAGPKPAIQQVFTPPLPTSQTTSAQSATADHNALDFLARQRVIAHIQTSKPAKKDRKRRTCPKCALVACPGSQKASNCRNKCRDCGETCCRGRNSKKLHKTCREGWDP